MVFLVLILFDWPRRGNLAWRSVDPKNFRLRRPFCEGVYPLDPRLREILAWWVGGGEIFQQPRFHRSTHWFFTRKKPTWPTDQNKNQ